MGKPDLHYECHEAVTSYRLRPNPDATPGLGYKHGAVLEFSDDGKDWSGYFFIAPEAMDAMAQALTEAARDCQGS